MSIEGVAHGKDKLFGLRHFRQFPFLWVTLYNGPMTVYTRKINYHETDKMGITHHSNYIKFMEEARVQYLEEIGMPFEEVERKGIGSPVVGLDIDYKTPTEFADILEIEVKVLGYNGLKLEIGYVMKNKKTGALCVTAHSRHCFLKDGKLYNFKRAADPYDELMQKALEEDSKSA